MTDQTSTSQAADQAASDARLAKLGRKWIDDAKRHAETARNAGR